MSEDPVVGRTHARAGKRALVDHGDGDGELPAPPRPRILALSVVLASAMGVSALPSMSFSALSPTILPELGISVVGFGSIHALVFVVAMVGSTLVGRVVDRLSPRVVLASLFLLSSSSLLVLMGARSYPWLVATALLVGVGMATSNPVTNTTIALHVPASRRGAVIGVKQSGVHMGQLLAGGCLVPLAAVVGWRTSVAAGAVLVLVLLLAMLRVVPRAGGDVAAPEPLSLEGRGSSVGLLAVYIGLVGAASQATSYLPLYAYEAVGASPTMAGLVVGVVGAVAVAARIGLGRIANRGGRPAVVLATVAGLAALSGIGIALAERVGMWLLWLSAVGYGASALAANAAVMVVLMRTVDRAHLGRATGTVAMGMYMGFAIGPISFGAIVDATGSYGVAWLAVSLVCVTAGLIGSGAKREAGTTTVNA